MRRVLRRPLTHQELAKFLLAAIFLTAPLLLHFKRNHQPGRLSQAGYETVQAARYLADKRAFRTQAVRPLETRYLKPAADGTLPDLRHGPLHLVVNATAIKALRETKPGRGDRAAIYLQLFLTLLAALASGWLARRLFGEWGGIGHGVRAGALCALGGGAMALALEPDPAVLGAFFMALLAAALLPLDGEASKKQTVLAASAAGLLWGLTFLTIYSALVFLPLIALHLFRVTRHKALALGAFLSVSALVALPAPLLALRASGNPLYHAQLLELVMHTPTYPGESLYNLSSMPRSIPAFLADGGVKEVLRKLGRNLAEYIPQALAMIGPFVAMLVLGSGLIRFTDSRLNRLRALALGMVGAHLLGLALFFPARSAVSLLFVHVPLLAVFGSAFLEIAIRSRRLAALPTQLAVVGWTALACLPGLAIYATGVESSAPATAMFEWLGSSDPGWKRFEERGKGVLASDVPGEVAFRLGAPCLALPPDSLEMGTCEERLEQRIEGIFVTPALLTSEKDPILQDWRDAQTRIAGYWNVVSDLPPIERGAFTRQYQLKYPAALGGAMQRYQPLPVAEPGLGRHSLVFWYNGPDQ